MRRDRLARMEWDYTIEDYVRLEEHSNLKHEYCDGSIRAMGGGTLDHARITSTIIRLLGTQLEGRPCAVYSSDARVRVLATNVITYPDVSVACGAVEQDVDDRCAMMNPSVVVEVTSPSSERYDRGGKLEHYKRVPSVRDIVIVSHRERAIEVHHRGDDGAWSVVHVTTGVALVTSIACALEVEVVYHDPLAAS